MAGNIHYWLPKIGYDCQRNSQKVSWSHNIRIKSGKIVWQICNDYIRSSGKMNTIVKLLYLGQNKLLIYKERNFKASWREWWRCNWSHLNLKTSTNKGHFILQKFKNPSLIIANFLRIFSLLNDISNDDANESLLMKL